ncbi:hypothetical protein ACN28E_22485 [Archangium lansingense]|jgi:hypothetical protein|uniref:hypothetical protein n=1 Tax=Archangium lansingense TaxID=2995310 RepID=UPI003B7C6258
MSKSETKPDGLTRRRLLEAVGTAGGAAAAYETMALLGLVQTPEASASPRQPAPGADAAPEPVPRTRGYPNDDLVVAKDWTVTYVNGQLAVSCTVSPTNAKTDALTNLYVGLTRPGDASRFYCSGSTTLGQGTPPPGNSLTGLAQTYLYEPEVHGTTVLAVVFGYVQGSLGSNAFMLKRTFDVAPASERPQVSAQSENRHSK